MTCYNDISIELYTYGCDRSECLAFDQKSLSQTLSDLLVSSPQVNLVLAMMCWQK